MRAYRGAIVFVFLLCASHGQAATITVDTTADVIDDVPPCTLREAIRSANYDLPLGGCASGSGNDTIMLGPGTYLLTRLGPDEDDTLTGDLDIRSNIMIAPNTYSPTIIDGNGATSTSDRVFDIHAGTVELFGLTIQNGRVRSNSTANGGGINADASGVSLTLDSVTLQANQTSGGNGAGLYFSGASSLAIYNSVITENVTGGGLSPPSGGGIYASTSAPGGLLLSGSTVSLNRSSNGGGLSGVTTVPWTINDSTFLSNSANDGGGADFLGTASVTLSNTIFNANHAYARGGGLFSMTPWTATGGAFRANTAGTAGCGVYTEVWNATGPQGVSGVTFDANRSGVVSGDGGGIYVGHFSQTFAVTNSTFTNNTVVGNGGAIYDAAKPSTIWSPGLTVSGSTLSDNHATRGGAIMENGYLAVIENSTISTNLADADGGGIFDSAGASVALANVTLTGNAAAVVASSQGTGGGIKILGYASAENTIIDSNMHNPNGAVVLDDCAGSLVSLGYNLLRSSNGCSLTGTLNGVQVGVEALLGPLANNGGPTQTHGIGPGSPAIDAGNPTGCLSAISGEPLNTDQRGLGRYGYCDLGAVEFQGRCGDGFIQPGAETCDDGNARSKDGCSALCKVEKGYICGGQPSRCRLLGG